MVASSTSARRLFWVGGVAAAAVAVAVTLPAKQASPEQAAVNRTAAARTSPSARGPGRLRQIMVHTPEVAERTARTGDPTRGPGDGATPGPAAGRLS